MATFVDRAKDWWEGKAPRERKLLVVLGATAVVCLVAWVAMTIRGGLGAIEKKNDRSRRALAAIDQQRILNQSRGADTPQVTIPEDAVALDSYLEGIITETQLKSPPYPEQKGIPKGQFIEATMHISLQDLTIYQLKDLLQKIETQNPVVVVTELHVKKRTFGEATDRVDVDLTVATYSKKKDGAKPGSGSGAGSTKGEEKGG